MSNTTKRTGHMIHLVFRNTITLLLIFAASAACASPRHGRTIVIHHSPRHGKVVHMLPNGYKTVWVGNKKYYQHRGIYYRRARTGFIAVGAPIGVIVVSLPLGHTRVVIGGATYYQCDGVYYKRVPSGYMVVEAPPSHVVIVKKTPYAGGESQPAGELVSATQRILNVRSGPGKDFDVIHRVRRGDTLEVHGHVPDWLYVKLPSGEYGWVMTKYTSQTHSRVSG